MEECLPYYIMNMRKETIRMHIVNIPGMVQTVLGQIAHRVQGVTLCHEHCSGDPTTWLIKPTELSQKAMPHKPITREYFGRVWCYPLDNWESLRLLAEDLAIRELRLYGRSGSSSLVDVAGIGIDSPGPVYANVHGRIYWSQCHQELRLLCVASPSTRGGQ